jgi:hypothetical protein
MPLSNVHTGSPKPRCEVGLPSSSFGSPYPFRHPAKQDFRTLALDSPLYHFTVAIYGRPQDLCRYTQSGLALCRVRRTARRSSPHQGWRSLSGMGLALLSNLESWASSMLGMEAWYHPLKAPHAGRCLSARSAVPVLLGVAGCTVTETTDPGCGMPVEEALAVATSMCQKAYCRSLQRG